MTKQLPYEIVFVRHGQSHLNLAKAGRVVYFETEADRASIVGIPDHKIDLTDLGVRQALATGQALRKLGKTFDYAYDTGYLRTVRTLDHMLEAYSESERGKIIRQPPNIFLRERSAGHTYNFTKAEVALHFPWLEAYWATHGPVFAQPPGGESIADVIKRVRPGLDQIEVQAAGKRAIVCVHGRVLAAIRFLYEGWSYDQLEAFVCQNDPRNCGVTTYTYSTEKDRLILQSYNRCYWS